MLVKDGIVGGLLKVGGRGLRRLGRVAKKIAAGSRGLGVGLV